ncbi:MAG: hypothetical protein HUK20_02520 [Fibrobacter sp.]|nr:hypothetical protein [Fibrobacter sp.]
MKQYEYNVMAQSAEHSFKRPYTKASMQIIAVESEGFFTASGAATRQIEGFGKESTDDWF